MLTLLRQANSIRPALARLAAASTACPHVFRELNVSAVAMGADCCGVDNGVRAMTIEDRSGDAPAATTSKSHAEYLAEKQPFYAKRIEVFEQYRKREQEKLEKARAADVKVKVVLPDGSEKEAVKGVTTPHDVAKGISPGLAKKVVVAHVDGHEWDVHRPLVGDCALKLCGLDTPEGMDVRRPAALLPAQRSRHIEHCPSA
jgi:TGS domain